MLLLVAFCFFLYILKNNKGFEVTLEMLLISIEHVLFYRQGRFEENILISLAKQGFTLSPQSKLFVETTNYTARIVGKTFTKLVDEGVVDKEEMGYYVSDVLLKLMLFSKLLEISSMCPFNLRYR